MQAGGRGLVVLQLRVWGQANIRSRFPSWTGRSRKLRGRVRIHHPPPKYGHCKISYLHTPQVINFLFLLTFSFPRAAWRILFRHGRLPRFRLLMYATSQRPRRRSCGAAAHDGKLSEWNGTQAFNYTRLRVDIESWALPCRFVKHTRKRTHKAILAWACPWGK